VTAVGVTLSEALGAPPGARCTSASRHAKTAACGQASAAARGEVDVAASGCGMLSETFICRETFEPRVSVTARTASMRQPVETRQAREMANCTMTGPADQGSSERERASARSATRPVTDSPTSWKDPL
jgi:hypothetical protein